MKKIFLYLFIYSVQNLICQNKDTTFITQLIDKTNNKYALNVYFTNDEVYIIKENSRKIILKISPNNIIIRDDSLKKNYIEVYPLESFDKSNINLMDIDTIRNYSLDSFRRILFMMKKDILGDSVQIIGPVNRIVNRDFNDSFLFFEDYFNGRVNMNYHGNKYFMIYDYSFMIKFIGNKFYDLKIMLVQDFETISIEITNKKNRFTNFNYNIKYNYNICKYQYGPDTNKITKYYNSNNIEKKEFKFKKTKFLKPKLKFKK